MDKLSSIVKLPPVALLAEGVDRNSVAEAISYIAQVALLAEGVDRNQSLKVAVINYECRPPRGGRG